MITLTVNNRKTCFLRKMYGILVIFKTCSILIANITIDFNLF